MIPKLLEKQTLRMHHEGFGHIGASRMIETMKLRYFWPTMDEDTKRHTRKCINCGLRKTYQSRPKVPIMKYDLTQRVLDRVHIDLTGPLPKTQNGHRYILVIKDYLTKYVWLVPLYTKGMREVAEAFVTKFVCQAGIPAMVVSDKGNEFVNKLLKNVSRVMGINRISTTPYNPRSDGFVENHNKTMKDQLYNYVDGLQQDDWDIYLPTAQLLYNSAVSTATGFSPMLLMYGREANMPSWRRMQNELDRAEGTGVHNEFVRSMVEAMGRYHDHAIQQATRNKSRFNVRVKQPLKFIEYQKGQQFFLVRRPTYDFKSTEDEEDYKITMKLLERFEGPYTVLRKVNPVVYEAEIDGKEKRVHAINMKPF